MSNLKAKIRDLKHHAVLGGMSDAAFERVRARIHEAVAVSDVSTEQAPSVGAMYFEYLKWMSSQYISRPALAGAFSVVMVAGGWMTTVNAADSLPGQKLYSIKMITERTQLQLASLDRRAVLHTEFAGRRLQEASDLQELGTDDSDRDSLVHQAIEAYKQEVSSAGDSLRQLKDEGDETALATAASVQQNLQIIDTSIDDVVTTADAVAAKEVTKEVSQVATDVAVEVHEEQQSELSTNELKRMFKSQLGEIEARQRFDLARIEVIRLALTDKTINYTGIAIPTSAEIGTYSYSIQSVEALLSRAMNNFAAGGYRGAFEDLQAIDASLLETEAKLAEAEINIMQAKAQTSAVTETETPGTDIAPSL